MGEPFFHRRTTHEAIRRIATASGDWVVYAGLGVTIDRTGLSWSGLVDNLLARFVPDPGERAELTRRYDPVQRATILSNYYEELALSGSGNDIRSQQVAELRVDLRRLLYGPHQTMRGKLSQSIVEFSLGAAVQGRAVAVVTPNYDDYLLEDLRAGYQAWAQAHAQRIPDPDDLLPNMSIPLFVRDDEEVEADNADAEDQVVVDAQEVLTASEVSCTHIHGFVPRTPGRDRGRPILDEGDYSRGGASSRDALTELFEGRNVLIVGSSLTDAPLVGALLATRDPAQGVPPPVSPPTRPLRVALLPGDAPRTERAGSSWVDRRLHYLGVEAVYPDFYIQVAQFIHEVRKTVEFGDAERMLDHHSPRRYGSRLTAWWQRWYNTYASDPKTQQRHHDVLAQAVLDIRRDVNIPMDENLKLEAWIRWQPDVGRDLGLWASSVGTWSDPYTMRRDAIAPGSKYRSVQIFCNGAPTFLVEAPDSTSRWRSYFGSPVWYDTEQGRVPVGVISLASMKDPSRGSLHPMNLSALDAGLVRMQKIGGDLFGTLA